MTQWQQLTINITQQQRQKQQHRSFCYGWEWGTKEERKWKRRKKREKRITKPMSIGQSWTDVIKIAIIIYEMIASLWWPHAWIHRMRNSCLCCRIVDAPTMLVCHCGQGIGWTTYGLEHEHSLELWNMNIPATYQMNQKLAFTPNSDIEIENNAQMWNRKHIFSSFIWLKIVNDDASQLCK